MVIATPLALADAANTIGRALDPDVGGDRSFAVVLCAETPRPATHVVFVVLLTGGCAMQCQTMLAHAEMLHAASGADYAARWPELEAPSLADCTEFLENSIITIELRGRSLDDVLQGIGMVRLLGASLPEIENV